MTGPSIDPAGECATCQHPAYRDRYDDATGCFNTHCPDSIGHPTPPADPDAKRREPRFPADPLLRLWDNDPVRAAAALGLTARNVRRWRHTGLGLYLADRMACRAGLHPSALWPDWIDAPLPNRRSAA